MNNTYLAQLEAILFAYAEPIQAKLLAQMMAMPLESVEELLSTLRENLRAEEHGIQLICLEGGWQLTTKNTHKEIVQKALNINKNTKLSNAAMETLAIIAYNQPVSRSFVEQVRGVDSNSVISNLLQKELIEEYGRLDLPGHPIAFKTTPLFLRTFGIMNLSELPNPLQEQEDEE